MGNLSEVVLDRFEQSKAILRNRHIVYTSRRHGTTYVEKRLAAQDPSFVAFIALMVVEMYQDVSGFIFAAPEDGAPVFVDAMHKVAQIESVRLRKTTEGKGGFHLSPEDAEKVHGRKVHIFDDILTTGGTLKRLVEVLEAAGAIVENVIVIVNRGGVTAEDLGVPNLASLATIDLTSYNVPAGEPCPMCLAGIAIDLYPGHGKDFLEELAANGKTYEQYVEELRGRAMVNEIDQN